MPMASAWGRRSESSRLVRRPPRSAAQRRRPKPRVVQAMTSTLRASAAMVSLRSAPADRHRNRRRRHMPAERPALRPGAGEAGKARARQAGDVAAEIDQHRAERAEMSRDIEDQRRRVLRAVLPEGGMNEDEMRGGADRQELGNALDEREKDDEEERQGRSGSGGTAGDIAPPGGCGLTRISRQGHGLRGAVGPAGKESCAARCGASGKRLGALCRPDSAALRVAPRRPPAAAQTPPSIQFAALRAAASRASTVGSAPLFCPLLAERTPGQRRRP